MPKMRGWVTLAGALLVGACASAEERAALGDAAMRGEVSITVENQNFYDANVYALLGTERRRLGSVTGNQTATFTFPWTPQPVRMQVDFIGADGFVTESIPVNPGDDLELLIQAGSHRLR